MLLVEDSRTHARIISRLLRPEDLDQDRFDLDVVGNLAEGIERAVTTPGYDVVLLDLTLPDSAGEATYRRFVERAPDVPIVVMTSIDDEQLATDLVHHGAQDYIVKSQASPRSVRSSIRYARERHAIQRELAQTVEALERANQRVHDFTSMATHELLSPMTSIQGFAKTLAQHWQSLSEDQVEQQLAVIDRQSEHLIRLVRMLLQYARLESDTIEASPSPVPLARVLRDVASSFASTGTEVQVACQKELVAYADPDHVQSIVQNLISNAVKYGAPPIEVRADQVRDHVEVAVTDHGDGVPAEFVGQLFQRFSRDQQAGAKAHGTGVGLYVVRELALANHGDVRYEPAASGGACFVVRLPLADADPASAPAATEHEETA